MSNVIAIAAVVSLLAAATGFLRWLIQRIQRMEQTRAEQMVEALRAELAETQKRAEAEGETLRAELAEAQKQVAAERAALVSELDKAQKKVQVERAARLKAEQTHAQAEKKLQSRVNYLENQLQRRRTRPPSV